MIDIQGHSSPQNPANAAVTQLTASIADAIAMLATALRAVHGERPSAQHSRSQFVKNAEAASPLKPSDIQRSHFDRDDLSKRSSLDKDFCALWRPGREISLYVAGCQGSARLSRLLRRRAPSSIASSGNVFKIGTAVPRRLQKRLSQLCNHQYAAVESGSYPPRMEAGFDNWCFRKIDGLDHHSAPHYVKVMQHEWRINLPASMTTQTFETELRSRSESRSIHTWAQTAQGQKYLRDRDIDPRICLRETHYGSGFGARQSPATELYLFDERPIFYSL